MRHAKSDWEADYGADHDRPLDGRGIRSARIMGRVLAAEGSTPQLVITSTAVRARTTAELADDAGDWSAEIVPDPALYDGGVDVAVEVIAAAPDIDRLMVVGHQPTWSMLVAELSGRRVEMRTATVAVIQFPTHRWSEVGSLPGSLTSVHQPRAFMGGVFDRDRTTPEAR